MSLKKNLQAVVALPLLLGLGTAYALPANLSGSLITPTIVAGAPPDSPAARVDPNLVTSPFSGVVSINIRYDGSSFICSGTLVSKRHVVSAGHCIDTNGNGAVVDLNKPGTDVRVVFNSAGNVNALITATSVAMHNDYKGFGNCPVGVGGFCLNDDIAVITMGQDAPASAKIYRTFMGDVGEGQLVKMVGYGRSGTGDVGYNVSPSFTIKRSGENYMDLFDLDDEQNFAGGPKEVWYADFDGVLNGVPQDTFCDLFSVCTPVLPNDREAGIGGGDSGGPSFMLVNGEYMLVANNTFSGRWAHQIAGSFGTYFGGIMMSGYYDFLGQATGGSIGFVPEPASSALVLSSLGLMGVALRRRRIRQ